MKYTPVTLDEMKSALTGWTEVLGSTSTREYVYEKAIPEDPGIVVRVCTSIHKDTSVARKCGGDAIRIYAVNIPARQGWIKTVRVFRVEGWRENLNKAINRVYSEARNRCRRLNSIQTVRFENDRPGFSKIKDQNPKLCDCHHNDDGTWNKSNCKLHGPATLGNTWTKSGDTYVTESSDLDIRAERTGQPRNQCPHCGKFFGKKDITKIDKDASGEDVYGWHFKCPSCSSHLLVIND